MSLFKNRTFLFSLSTGVVFFVISVLVNSYAVLFATDSVSNSVTDVILSNTRVFNVDGFFVYGTVVLAATILFLCFYRLKAAPFVFKSMALFVFIRAFFVSLTHISPYPQHIAITPNIFVRLFPSTFTGGDQFFSGHTGLPFLLALIFWDVPFLRALFLGFSILFAIVVLLGHLHYSIDVASAFFITYTIFVIAKSWFKKDWLHLKSGW